MKQSLRGDPCNDGRFSILVNYRDASYPLEIVTVDLKTPHPSLWQTCPSQSPESEMKVRIINI
jgi:hypothetical protein